ncbi:MAG: hypothetical protein ACOH2H_00785 [Cypionkella sp.]
MKKIASKCGFLENHAIKAYNSRACLRHTNLREELMVILNRRSALSIGSVGLAIAAVSPLLLAAPGWAEIPEYGPNDGVDFSPGVRWVQLGEVESQIDAYSKIMFGDAIYQPGAADPVDAPVMDTDMFCYILKSDFEITKTGLAPYMVKQGQAYTCGKGKTDHGHNVGPGLGIMRVSMLMPK